MVNRVPSGEANGPLAGTVAPPAGWQQRVTGIVIGGSAGSIEALSVLLPALPATLALPLFIVVHLPRERPSLLADIFRDRCALQLREAQDKEPVTPGTVYFAPPDYHLLLDRDPAGGLSLALSVDEPVHHSRPAIDVLFESAADALRAGALGIVLSGGNDDGARGLACIRAAGGVAVVQLPSEARVAVMPQAAIASGPVHQQLGIAGIGALLASLAPAEATTALPAMGAWQPGARA